MTAAKDERHWCRDCCALMPWKHDQKRPASLLYRLIRSAEIQLEWEVLLRVERTRQVLEDYHRTCAENAMTPPTLREELGALRTLFRRAKRGKK